MRLELLRESLSRLFLRNNLRGAERGEFYRELGRENASKGRVLASALILWFFVNLIADFFIFVPADDYFYLYFDLFIIAAMFIYLLILLKNPSPLVSLRLTTGIAFVFLTLAAAIAVWKESILFYFIPCFLIAAAFFFRLWVSVILFTVPLLIYHFSHFVKEGFFLQDKIALIETVGVVFFAWLVSRVLFFSHLRTFTAQRKVRKLTEEQERIIEERTEELQQANTRLKERLDEREVLMKEVHHRVKNNLQLLASLMHLVRDDCDRRRVEDIFEEMENRILSMAMIHEQLYSTDALVRLDAADYLEELINRIASWYMEKSPSPGEVIKRLDSLSIGIDRAIHLGLITTEILTNAFIHAFREEASNYHVEIAIKKTDVDFTLTISDNGQGMECPPKAGENCGLGLTLVEALAQQEGGEYGFACDDGVVFIFRAPLEPN